MQPKGQLPCAGDHVLLIPSPSILNTTLKTYNLAIWQGRLSNRQ